MIIIIALIILMFLLWILDGYLKEREDYEKAMLEKDMIDNRSVHLHNHYPSQGEIKNIIEFEDVKR